MIVKFSLTTRDELTAADKAWLIVCLGVVLPFSLIFGCCLWRYNRTASR